MTCPAAGSAENWQGPSEGLIQQKNYPDHKIKMFSLVCTQNQNQGLRMFVLHRSMSTCVVVFLIDINAKRSLVLFLIIGGYRPIQNFLLVIILY